jgi:hypothetical protein
MSRDSGMWKGPRYIRAGRQAPRDVLSMATLAATRWNPVLQARYRHLVERGKRPKVALVARMRKLLVHLDALVRDHLARTDVATAGPATPRRGSGSGRRPRRGRRRDDLRRSHRRCAPADRWTPSGEPEARSSEKPGPERARDLVGGETSAASARRTSSLDTSSIGCIETTAPCARATGGRPEAAPPQAGPKDGARTRDPAGGPVPRSGRRPDRPLAHRSVDVDADWTR